MTQAASRRALFGRLRGGPPEVRPPWAIAEERFTGMCRTSASCQACICACPSAIIVSGRAGYPRVDFTRGACTLCARCADACPEDCFASAPRGRAWGITALVSDRCVEQKGIACRMCADVCDVAAIRFRPRLGGGATVSIDGGRCTGCGACVAPCPVAAVTVAEPKLAGAVA